VSYRRKARKSYSHQRRTRKRVSRFKAYETSSKADLERDRYRDRVFYHVTTAEDLERIVKEGLIPYVSYEERGGEPAVFLWHNYEDAERFAEYKYDDDFGGLYAILEVRLPPRIKPVRREVRSPEAREAGWTQEYLVKERIPKRYLKIKFIQEADTENFRRFKRKLRRAGLL